MKKGKGLWLLVPGVCLILCSLLLMLLFQQRIRSGAEKSSQAAKQIEALLPQRSQGMAGSYADAVMPVLELGGKDYVALLEIPLYGLTLPVANQWDSSELSAGPGRFYGSAYDHSMVIGGGDYPGQFDFCDRIEYGTYITVTDMTGALFTYEVCDVDRSSHAETPWLLDGDGDLTLFCRDTYSMEYLAVRCKFIY